MEKNDKLVWILLAAAVALAIACVLVRVFSDRTAPKITFPDDSVTYDFSEDESVLLQNVTAKDDRDGDVSKSLRVGSIKVSSDGVTGVVTYYAKDSHNNVSSAVRRINVTGVPAEAAESEE
ncbi:MAG: hypothetical protein J6U26_01470 [Lachnospiraceae bacterium]|nr:hypothetical protein [Lachnospiraceae bacterium]